MTLRLHTFDALDNFRDFGDYPTTDGRRVRSGRLFRSAHQARLTEADLDRFSGFGIGTVVDLRRPVEREKQPSRRAAGYDPAVIASDLDRTEEAPHITFLKSGDLTPDSGRRFMTGTYGRMPFAASHIELFTAWFEALAETDAPVLIHCAAGKDRTGLLAALTHHLLGVGDDNIMADYLLTNQAVDLQARAPDIGRQLQAMTGRIAAHDAIVAFMGVEQAFLEAAFAAITDRYGDLDTYLEQALGVDPSRRLAIQSRLLVQG